MSEGAGTNPISQRIVELRHEFDSSFSRPWQSEQVERDSILCFTAEGRRFAAPLTGLQGLAKAGTILPLPSRSPALLGLSVVRARILPVYSIARLMGAPARATEAVWLAVLRGRESVGVALDTLDGYANQLMVSTSAEGHMSRLVAGSVAHLEELYGLLDCKKLYEAITSPQASLMKGRDS
jgi:chemotaxis signal transduction protein